MQEASTGGPSRPAGVRLRAGAAFALSALLLLTSCTSGPDRAALPAGEKHVAPVSVGAKAVWTGADLGLDSVHGVALRGRTAVVSGPVAGRSGSRLAVVDADSGRPHWVRHPGVTLGGGIRLGGTAGLGELTTYDGQLPITGGAGGAGAWSLLVPYTAERAAPRGDRAEDGDRAGDGDRGQGGLRGRGEREQGVAALAGKDGRVLWKAPLPAKGEVRALAVDGERALFAVTDRKEGTVTSYALEVRTGRVLWKQDRRWIYALAGEVALGVDPSEARWDPSEGETEGGHLVGVDAASGKELWSTEGRYDRTHLQGHLPGRAVVRVEQGDAGKRGEDMRQVKVLDTATGKVKHTLEDSFYRCVADGGTGGGGRADGGAEGKRGALLACVSLHRPSLVTLRAGERGTPVPAERTGLEEVTEDGVNISTVHGDRIYLNATVRPDDSEDGSAGKPVLHSVAVDRAGNTLREELPGSVAAVSDRHGAFLSPKGGNSTQQALAVHRLAEGDTRPADRKGPGRAEQQPLGLTEQAEWSAEVGRSGFGSGPDRERLRGVPDRTEGIGLSQLSEATLADGLLVLRGSAEKDRSRLRLVVVDPASGKVRWSVGDSDSPRGGRGGGGSSADRAPTDRGPTDKALTDRDSADRSRAGKLLEMEGPDGTPTAIRLGFSSPVAVGRGELLLEYAVPGADRRARPTASGVAAVGLKDGEIRRTLPAEVPTGADGDGTSRLATADGTYTVLERSASAARTTTSLMAEVRDTKTFRLLWNRSGVAPRAVAQGLVIADRPEEVPFRRFGDDWRGTVGAFDAKSGAERWTLSDRYRNARFVAALGDRALVVRHAGGTAVVDATDGRELARTAAELVRCEGEGESLAVCVTGGFAGKFAYPVTLEVTGGGKGGKGSKGGGAGRTEVELRELLRLTRFSSHEAWGDRYFAQEPRGGSRAVVYRTMDAHGRTVGEPLPARPLAIDDSYVVLGQRSPGPGFPQLPLTVHKRGGGSGD